MRGEPKLVLYGPDSKHGAKKKAGFKEYVYYIRHHDSVTSTGYGLSDHVAAQEALLAYHSSVEHEPARLSILEAMKRYTHSLSDAATKEKVYYAALNLFVKFPVQTCGDVTKAHCQAYIQLRRAECPPPAEWTIWTELSKLRMAIGHVGLDRSNVMLPPAPGSSGKVITRAEAAKLLRATREIRFADRRRNMRLLIMMALYACQRKTAILSLTWAPRRGHGHVNLNAGYIDFKRYGEPENKKRRSHIPIPDQLITLLRAQRRHTSEYLFERVTPAGLTCVKDIKSAWDTVRRAAEMHDLRIHDLIHSGATWRAEYTPQHVLSKFVAKSPQTLSGIYLHATASDLEKAARSRRRSKTGM